MKKQFKFFFAFYIAFLIVGAACDSLIDDDCGPFPNKYSITELAWNAPATNSAVMYDDVEIDINTVGTYFFASRNSFNLITKSYACSPIPPETDDRLLSMEITANADYSPLYTQGTNLIDIFNVEVYYARNDMRQTYSLAEFLSSDRKFPDRMLLRLNTPPATDAEFSFIFKFTIDGAELDYFEFNTTTFEIRN